MFTSLKEKIINVGKNVGLVQEGSLPQNAVNFNAGGEILQHYQEQWEQIHNLNEINTKKASDISNTIELLNTKTINDKKNIDYILHILNNSSIKNNISNCLSEINQLYNSCEQVEKSLIELENVIDEVEFQNMKKQHEFHLQQYELRKKENHENVKKSLEEKYQKFLLQEEMNQMKVTEERQQVFQEAFKNDLEFYKQSGTVPQIVSPKKKPSALLEEIELDFDQSELDHFFDEK